nr:hypothetical protein BaRGS_015746 [Batillaria attramentaria]
MEGGVPFNPLTCVASRLFITRPSTDMDTDEDGPWITSMAATDSGRLVMIDNRNKMVKVLADLTSQTPAIQGVVLETWPYRLALLRDGQIAVTSDKKRLYFIDVSGIPTVVTHVQTAREYWGVGSVTSDDTLVVSCVRDRDGPAGVDVITRDAHFSQ